MVLEAAIRAGRERLAQAIVAEAGRGGAVAARASAGRASRRARRGRRPGRGLNGDSLVCAPVPVSVLALTGEVRLADGRQALLRAARPADAAAVHAFVRELSPQTSAAGSCARCAS